MSSLLQPRQIVADLELEDPIRGTLVGPDGETREFVGWLEFHAALNHLVRIDSRPEVP